MNAFAAILAKDLRIELRTLESVPAMALFAITTFVIFRYGLDREQLAGSLAAGVLLVTILFAAVLAINRVFVAEREQGGFDAIRLAPVDGTSLYAAKIAALVIYLVVLELIALPVFGVFFLDEWAGLGPLCAILALLDVGAVGEVEEMLGSAPQRTRVLVTHDIEHGLAEGDLVLALAADGAVAFAGAAGDLSAREARAIYGGAT